MQRNYPSQEEQWWHGGRKGVVPGNVVPIVGTGRIHRVLIDFGEILRYQTCNETDKACIFLFH